MPMIHVRSVYTSCCSLAFLPPSHSYLILTVFSNTLTFLCSPLISSSSSPTVFPPPSCASQITVFAADTFIAVRPIELEEGATPIRVTLSLPPLHPAAWNPPIFSSAAAFWNPSFPPSLSSKSPHPLRVALRLVPCSSVTKLLKPPVMTAPIQGSQVPFSNTWCINIKDFEQSCVRLWSFRLFDFWPSRGRDFNRSGGVSEG